MTNTRFGFHSGRAIADSITLKPLGGGKAGVRIFTKAGAPTKGSSGDGAGNAGIGSLLIDTTNGDLYINDGGAGTRASPDWLKVGTQS